MTKEQIEKALKEYNPQINYGDILLEILHTH